MRAPPASTSRRTASPTSRKCSTRSSRVWRRTARRWPRPTSRISRSSSSPYRPPTSAASRPASNTRRHFSPFDCCSTFDRGTQRPLLQRTIDRRPEPRPSRSGHPRPDPVSRSPLQQIRPSMRLTMIPHSRPSITDDDAERVARVVRSGQLAQGPEVAALERELAARLGVQDAAAVASGSAALELALGALGVGAGDEVLIASYVCDALYHAVRRVGATPVLVDADAATLSLSAKDALARRTSRTRAVIVPHAFGLAADLEPFQALEVPVIEDCAQALGAELDDGRLAGSRGALAVCSFYATKMIAAGEGGAVAGPAALIARVREARDYDERATLAPRTNAKLTD